MASSVITSDVIFQGAVTLTGGGTASTNAYFNTKSAAILGLPFESWRKFSDLAALLGTAASSDLGLVSNTPGTTQSYIWAGDLKNAGATTRKMRRHICLPQDYVTGGTLTLRFSAGMVTTVASSTATIDVEAWRLDRDDTAPGSDICATSATTCNSLTFADKSFTITPTTLAAGDWIEIVVALAVNDAATGTAVDAAIAAAELLYQQQG